MATNKDQMPIINEDGIKKALEAFKLAYKENKEKYKECNVDVDNVVSLTEGFSGKNVLLASTVITAVMIAMPPREFIALMGNLKLMSEEKYLKAVKEIIMKKSKGADNDIDN